MLFDYFLIFRVSEFVFAPLRILIELTILHIINVHYRLQQFMHHGDNLCTFKVLQTSGLDFINAFNMVKATKIDIQQIHRDYAMVVNKTDHFVQHPNEVLEERGCDVLIESSFPAKWVPEN